jgi:nucleoside-diphosphate-sugar epimerase
MVLKTQLRRAIWLLVDVVLVNLTICPAYLICGSLYSDSRCKNLMMDEYHNMLWQIVLVVTIVLIGTFFFFELYKPICARVSKFAGGILHGFLALFSSGTEVGVLAVGEGAAGQGALWKVQCHYRKKQDKTVHDVEAFGTGEHISSVLHRTSADDISVFPASDVKMNEITSSCEGADKKLDWVPGVQPVSAASDDSEKILLIGGAGYIGSVMVRKMLQRGYKVRVLDSLLYGEQSIAELYADPNFELIVGDFRHVDTMVRAARGVDAIVHLGGIVGDPACQLDPEFAIEVNSVATRMISNVCTGFGIRRFIFASTCSVYGADDGILSEHSMPNPLGVYARSKVDSERILLEGANGIMSPTIMRMATVFGLSHRPRFDLVINLLTAKAAEGEGITIFGGYQWRPFIHVGDVAKAFIKCLESSLEKVGHQIFNVGSNELNCQISDIGKMISDLLPGSRIERQRDLIDKRNYRVCFDKIRDTLDFTCDRTIQDGVSEISDAIHSGLIRDYRDARFSNYLWLEKQPEKRAIFFHNSHYE